MIYIYKAKKDKKGGYKQLKGTKRFRQVCHVCHVCQVCHPDDDILVENVCFLLIVYTPLFYLFCLVYIS